MLMKKIVPYIFAVSSLAALPSCEKEQPVVDPLKEATEQRDAAAKKVRIDFEGLKKNGLENYVNSRFAIKAFEMYGIDIVEGGRIPTLEDSIKVIIPVVDLTYTNNGDPLPAPFDDAAYKAMKASGPAFLGINDKVKQLGGKGM